MPSLRCPRCDFANEGSVRFCGRCGAAITADSALPAGEPAQQGAGTAGSRPCPRCGTPYLPGVRFCGRCGADLSGAGTGTAAAGTAYPRATASAVLQSTPRKAGHRLPWALLVAALGVIMAVLAGASQLVMSHPAQTCGVRCPPPPPPAPAPPPLGPSGPPLPAQTSYTSTAYGFSVAYPGTFPPSGTDAQSVQWSYTVTSDNSSFLIQVQGEAAGGRTPQQIVDSLQQSKLSGATPVFTITGAELGYTAGYGVVYDLTSSPQNGQQQHLRVVIEAAVRNDIAVELVALSQFVPDQNEHPSPAQMEPVVESNADALGNTITWQGEPAI